MPANEAEAVSSAVAEERTATAAPAMPACVHASPI